MQNDYKLDYAMESYEDVKKNYRNLFDELSSVLALHSSKERLSTRQELSLIKNPDFLKFLNPSPAITAIIDFQKGVIYL